MTDDPPSSPDALTHAQRVIDESVRGLYFLSGTALVAGLALRAVFALDAILFAVLGFWLGRSRSPLPAGAILGVGALAACVAVVNLLGLMGGGLRGAGLLGAVLLIWIGKRSLVASKTLSSVR